MLLALLLSSPAVIQPALAGDDSEDDGGYLDDQDSGGKPKRHTSMSEGTVKEIQRGVFGKANVGGIGYLGLMGAATHPGMMLNLAVGQDFVDQEKLSMSWELSFSQGVNGGADFYSQAAAGCGAGAPCTEGDLRSYAIEALYEVSFYPTRRIGIGLRAGAGGLYSPLLIESNAYAKEVLPEFGLAADPGYHNSFHPMGMAGPTFEYYTKLAHFSVGVDADFIYALNWGMGWDASGYLKYTFGKKAKPASGS
jgi:hypothetical protein